MDDNEKVFLDIERTTVNSKGTAYVRLYDDLFQFLLKCQEENDIAGFKWDMASRTFGVVLVSKVQ